MCFFKVKHYFGHISGMVGPIDVKRKGSALVGYWVQYVTLTFDLPHDLDLGCFKFKFRNSSICRIVGLIDVKWKGSELIWYWAICMTLPFDHTHDLDLGVSRSESEIALSQEWGRLLTMNEKNASHPFMTMILTCVTMVGWADVLDSDLGDFRRRRAVDISSYLQYIYPQGLPSFSEDSFVRRFFCLKPFEVVMLWRTCGPKVLYSEVPQVQRLLCSEDSIFRKATHYTDSILGRFFNLKFI